MATHKEYRNIILPLALVEEIDALRLTKPTRNKVIFLIWFATNPNTKLARKSIGYEGFRPIASSLLVDLWGARYHKITKIINDNDFLQRDNFVPNVKCYGYRLHPRFFGSILTKSVKFSFKVKEDMQDFEKEYFDKEQNEIFRNNISQLELPKQSLYDALEMHIEGLDISQFIYDTDVIWRYELETVYEIDEKYNFIRIGKMQKWKALELATLQNKIVVMMGNKITITDVDSYLKNKAMYIRMSWGSDIENICDMDCLSVSRGAKGKRLFTNIANLPSKLLGVIKSHNGLEEIDLSCAQPTLLNHKMQTIGLEGTDVEMFNKLTTNGQFYQFFPMPKKQAKQMIFEVIFGDGKETKQVQAFKSKFPTVWDFIEDYKEENGGYQTLSHLLQKMEAHLFVDNIYRRLNEMKILCFTKHDSLLYRSEDAETVQEILKDEVEKFGLVGQFEITRTFKTAA